MDKRYNVEETEKKWAKKWVENKTYEFVETKKNYVIDSPPPYPYVSLHAGNFFNFAYQDFVARYKRLRGFSVLHPWGWDCHGLPAEIFIEKKYGKTAEKIGIEAFKELCEKHILENIENIRENQAQVIGMSVDWSKQYATMTDDYKTRVQKSFLEMVKKKYVYRKEAPVSWCVSCHTAIAEAQTDKIERETNFYHINLPLKNKKGSITIATTRPELMPSCVAVFVNPKDERYKEFIGEIVKIPFFGQEVKIIADEKADPEFGTGAVYHCTFGDKTDWEWVVKHKLPIIKSIEENGKLNENTKFLKDLTVIQARKKIVEKLEKEGLLFETKKTNQTINSCERCKTPLEILIKKQWFFATTKLVKEIAEASDKMKWHPSFAKQRLLDWNNNVAWDWVISRQRYWATPFPVWYCEKCDETIFANEKELPINPSKKIKKCKCGKNALPETDVMDTWMDSSISAHHVSQWLSKERKNRLSDLRSQGEEITKTWLFYTIARCLAYKKKLPFTDVLINGMVQGTDGKKMAKRSTNMILPEELFKKYSVDAYRQWVGKSMPGEAWPINPSEMEYSQKFLTKIWNTSRFIEQHLKNGKPKLDNFADKWIMNTYHALISKVTKHMDSFEWGLSLESLRNFLWHEFADYYLEMIKYRIYNNTKNSDESKKVLKTILSGTLRMLSPFTPFITEEIWNNLYNEESIHHQKWPKTEDSDEKILKQGDDLKTFISALRTWKTNNKLGLGKELSNVVIYASKKNVEHFTDDLKGTMRIKELTIEEKTAGTRINEKFGFSVHKV
ncbi:MAG: valine--tRNA ligase [Nanoarchaeota archaeon]|nr:valine--tRNA ligase [Nanoarchaeota archaeon]